MPMPVIIPEIPTSGAPIKHFVASGWKRVIGNCASSSPGALFGFSAPLLLGCDFPLDALPAWPSPVPCAEEVLKKVIHSAFVY